MLLCVCVGFVMFIVCMCGLCNVWVCVCVSLVMCCCVDFLMCGFVYLWLL